MNDKLLRAFIEASGYEIEEVFDQRKYNFECSLAAESGETFNELRGGYMDYKVNKKADDSFKCMESRYTEYAEAACKFESDSSVPMYILTREEFFAKRKANENI